MSGPIQCQEVVEATYRPFSSDRHDRSDEYSGEQRPPDGQCYKAPQRQDGRHCEQDARELAIASIQRGLKKGGIVHLDEAYVYLGLSMQAIGNIEGARNAFSKLRDVPGVSPRVLRLWTLYAETQLTGSGNLECSKVRRADHDSSSTSTDQTSGSGR
jgi:hypothetical protein